MNRRKDKAEPQQTHNLRSVGSKPCDFNRLKYTTYKAFGRKSLPNLDHACTCDRQKQKEKEKECINLNLRQHLDQQKEKVKSRRKMAVIVDKWKERHQKMEEIYLRKKGVLPQIKNNPIVMIATRDKLTPLPLLKKKKRGNFPSPEQETGMGYSVLSEVEEIFEKYSSEYKQPKFKKIEIQSQRLLGMRRTSNFSLELQKIKRQQLLHVNPNMHLRSVSDIEKLKEIVEDAPQRWEFTQEDDQQQRVRQYNRE